MLGLMEIAWGWCERDIYAVIRMWLGMMLFILAFFTFTLLNLVNNFQPLVTIPDINISGTQTAAVFLSCEFGFFNAFSMLTFLAIIVCLLEYTGNFLIAAYHYDNDSWDIVNVPKDLYRRFWVWDEARWGALKSESKTNYEEYRKRLDAQLTDLKTEIQ